MIPEIISGSSLLVAFISLVLVTARARTTDVVKVAERLVVLETKIDVFWRGVSLDAAKLLHSPHEKWAERDILLERFIAGTLTMDEAAKLATMLDDILADDDGDPAEVMAASLVRRYLLAAYGIT